MANVRLARELVSAGESPVDIRAALARGRLSRVRRGAYTEPRELDPVEQHRLLIDATLRQGHPGAVVSHSSAAVLRRLEVPYRLLDRVHLTRDRRGGGQRRTWLQVHGHPLPEAHLGEVHGIRATTLVRTAIDLGCALPLPDAVAIGDGALRLGASLGELGETLGAVGQRRGVRTARRSLELLDVRSESYGESVSRVLMLDRGIPTPEPQLVIRDRNGVVVARADFGWSDLGVVGEFDGRVKYGRELAPTQDPAEALWREKLREDLLRELGWVVVHGTWSDLYEPARWFERLERALARHHA